MLKHTLQKVLCDHKNSNVLDVTRGRQQHLELRMNDVNSCLTCMVLP
jgi:hypothetical protein